ncbi:MAG: LPS export ABC transporter periplasmic protein LptC [Bacteroidales bacterium]|nr:LPS export ABC transporter periplasmic protein LptC [Bacteroidales bacterium]
MALGCTNDMNDVSRFDRKDPPMQIVKDASVWRSEEGRLQLELTAPYVVQYREPDTRTHYPKGVDLRFYDAERNIKTYIRADKATSFDDKDILYAKDSVVIIDYGSGDTIYLEDITWRSKEDVVYSNRPVRAVNGNRVTFGDGFSSDAKLTNLRVIRQRGTIEFEE